MLNNKLTSVVFNETWWQGVPTTYLLLAGANGRGEEKGHHGETIRPDRDHPNRKLVGELNFCELGSTRIDSMGKYLYSHTRYK